VPTSGYTKNNYNQNQFTYRTHRKCSRRWTANCKRIFKWYRDCNRCELLLEILISLSHLPTILRYLKLSWKPELSCF